VFLPGGVEEAGYGSGDGRGGWCSRRDDIGGEEQRGGDRHGGCRSATGLGGSDAEGEGEMSMAQRRK
jgi:hypothetical protein